MARLRVRGRTVTWSEPLLMGIVNANPDSFSDPGRRSAGAPLQRARALIADGAAVIDVGAQSAITGRDPVDPIAEAAALVPVVRELTTAHPDALLSVDTYKPQVAGAVLEAGAHIINDVSGLRDLEIAGLCAEYGAGLVVMHTAAAPLTRRQHSDLYRDVAEEVAGFLAGRVALARQAGVPAESIVVDPGVDFAKTPAQTIALLRGIDKIVALRHPVLLALSRKDFVGALTGRAPADRDPGTLGAVAALREVPGQILRVHDVAGARDMLTVLDAITGDARIKAPPLPHGLRHQPVGRVREPR